MHISQKTIKIFWKEKRNKDKTTAGTLSQQAAVSGISGQGNTFPLLPHNYIVEKIIHKQEHIFTENWIVFLIIWLKEVLYLKPNNNYINVRLTMQVRKNSVILFYVSYLQNIRKCKYFIKKSTVYRIDNMWFIIHINKNIK